MGIAVNSRLSWTGLLMQHGVSIQDGSEAYLRADLITLFAAGQIDLRLTSPAIHPWPLSILKRTLLLALRLCIATHSALRITCQFPSNTMGAVRLSRCLY